MRVQKISRIDRILFEKNLNNEEMNELVKIVLLLLQ